MTCEVRPIPFYRCGRPRSRTREKHDCRKGRDNVPRRYQHGKRRKSASRCLGITAMADAMTRRDATQRPSSSRRLGQRNAEERDGLRLGKPVISLLYRDELL